MTQRILLVEDEEALTMTLVDRLVSEGYSVECAADGKIGLERALRGEVRSDRPGCHAAR